MKRKNTTQTLKNKSGSTTGLVMDISSINTVNRVKPLSSFFSKTLLALSLAASISFAPSVLAQQSTSYTYNPQGLVLTEDGPRTDVVDVTTYTYDTFGNRSSITNALGHTTQLLDYNGRGQPARVIDANGTETVLTYHVRGWLTSVTVVDPSGVAASNSVTNYTYDNVGQLIEITQPNGVVLTYTYDAARRLTQISNSVGESINYTLDNAGNRTSETIQTSTGTITYTVNRAFDELSRVMDIIGAENQITHFDYDVNDNNTAVTDPKTNVTNQIYDPLDRLQQSTDAANGTTQFGYDDQDRLTSVTDANGNTTTYSYDGFDNLTQISSPDTGTATYTYDQANNRTSMTDARGVVVNYSYDALNRLTGVTYPATPVENIVYQYDGVTTGNKGIGRLTQITDQSGSTHYHYDHRGNLLTKTTVIDGQTLVTSTTYDLANNPIEMTYPSGLVVNYTYDSQGRVQDITATRPTENPINIISDTEYLAFGPVKGMTYGNGLTQTLTYDQDYRLSTLTSGSALTTVLDLSYDYDANGNITTIDHLNEPTNNQLFSYDVLDRLSGSTGDYGSLSYQYDPIGNRLQKSTTENAQINTEDYSYNTGSNQLNSVIINPVTDNTVSNYQYDNNGNPTQISDTDTATENLTSTYNAANRLATISKSSLTANYTYNALGQRTTKQIVGNATTHYAYNESGQLLGEYTAQGQVIKEYLYFNGQPLAQVTANNIYTYHNDHLGTPRVLTDQNKNIVWQSSYTPFGEATKSVTTVENNLRFSGQYFDEETELHYNWFRYYDPATGRYITSDRIGLGDGLNTYAYVGGNPLKYFDPNGLARIESGLDTSGMSFTEANAARRAYAKTRAGKRENLLRQLNRQFNKDILEKCDPDSAIAKAFDRWTIRVNPNINSVAHQLYNGAYARTTFASQSTDFNYDFFKQETHHYSVFLHEFRHISQKNYDLTLENRYKGGSAKSQLFESAPLPKSELDANQWSNDFRAGKCSCNHF